jgi:hypothetical protein
MKTNLIMGLLLVFLVGCGVPEADGVGSVATGGDSATTGDDSTATGDDPVATADDSPATVETPAGNTLVKTGLIKKSTFDPANMTINNSSYMKIRGR